MVLNKTKWVTVAVVICFAILQALQPFIHAHVDAEHPIQKTGFHVGDEHEEVLNVEHLANYPSNVPHASHTISVDSSIKQDTDSMLFINTIFAVAFSICFILVLQFTHRLNPAFLLVPKESLKRRLPASRAPPKF